MKKQHFIALFLVLCFFLFLVPSTFAGTKVGDPEAKKEESAKTEDKKEDKKDALKPETKDDSTDRKTLKKEEMPTEIKVPGEEVKTEEPVVPEIKVDNPPKPITGLEITNVQFDDGQKLDVTFYNSPDDWTDASQPSIGERDIFKYEVIFERVDNRVFLKHLNHLLSTIIVFREDKEIFGEQYDVYLDFLNFLPRLKVKLLNLGTSRDLLTAEEVDKVNIDISKLKMVLKQNKKDKKFYRDSNKILNKIEIFESDLGEFYQTYSWVQKNWIKNIEQGRKLAAAFDSDRPEKVHNVLIQLSREIGLDSRNSALNLIKAIPSLLSIQKEMGTDDIEEALHAFDKIDFNKQVNDLKRELRRKDISDSEKEKLAIQLTEVESLRNQRELLFNDFRVYSMTEIIEVIHKFKPEVEDKYYRKMLKEYTVFAFDFLYYGDPRRKDQKYGKKLLALEMGKKKLGTRNFFKGQLSYLREGIKVLKCNMKEFKKIESVLKSDYEEYSDKTFADIFRPCEIINSNRIVLDGFEDHIKVIAKAYKETTSTKDLTISKIAEKFPIDSKPFIDEIEKNNEKYKVFEGDWKNLTFAKLHEKLNSEQEKNVHPKLMSFKKSIERNYETYGFLTWDVFSQVKVSEFGKHLEDTLKRTENKHESYKTYIATLNDTFKILKKHRTNATKLKVKDLTIEQAQQPIRDCLKDLDGYLINKYSIVNDITPDTVRSSIVTAYQAFGDSDLDYQQALAELEKKNFSPYQNKLKSALEKEGLTEEEQTAAQKQYDASLKLPEYRADLKKYINDKDLNTLSDYMDRFPMARTYKASFESDLITLEKMKDKLTYDKLVELANLDYSLIINYYSGAEILLKNKFVNLEQTGLTYIKRHNDFLITVKSIDNSKQFSYSPTYGPYKGHPEWQKPKIYKLLFGVLLYMVIFFVYYNMARSGKDIYVRPIAGLSAVEEAVGRATEMGRPVLYISGLSTISDIATLASINILGQVAKKIALYETPLIVPSYDPIVYTVQKEVVREAYLDVGKPDAFNEDSVFFLTQAQFAYAAGVNGIMVREKPATVFFMGMFYAESLIMAETGNSIGAIQIAGTDAVTQLPFFITACDYTLIGEELYAASAYLSRDPLLLSTLKAQDAGKLIIMILLVVGILLYTFGIWQEGFINFFENVPK